MPGGAVAILLDPFERQIANLAQLLSLSPAVCSSDSARPAFIEEYNQVARSAQDGTPEQGQEAVLAKIDGLLKSQANAVNALQQNTQLEFVNLYLATLHSVYSDPASEKLSALLSTLIASVNNPSTLSPALHFITPASPQSVRQQLISKLISSTDFAITHLDSLPSLPSTFAHWDLPVSDAEQYMERIIASLLEAENNAAAYSVLQAYFNPSSVYSSKSDSATAQKLQRTHVRLALNQPTVFTFPQSLPTLPEEKLVSYLFSNSSDASGLEESGLPTVNEAVLNSKRTSLALAKLLSAQVGKKVSYSEVAGATGAGAEEEDVEVVVIDAIKAKLIQARLHQPSKSISVLSSAYASLEASLPNQDKEKKLEQWRVIQGKLLAARKGLDGVMSSLRNVTGEKEVEVGA